MSTPPPISEKNLTYLALAGFFVAVLAGAGTFYVRYPYTEDGQAYLMIAYLLFILVLFFAIKLWKLPLIGVAVVFSISILGYANKKFDWRENYIQMAKLGQPFFLEEMIDRYPTYEEYTFDFLGAPDWVRFNEECVQPALLNQVVLGRCASFELIQRFYRIDMQAAMITHLNKMRETAKRIQEGQMKKRSEYIACLASKECAAIPLLPKGIDATRIDPTSRDYIGIRQAFWSLINERKMSQETCALTPICRALVNMKVVEPAKLPF